MTTIRPARRRTPALRRTLQLLAVASAMLALDAAVTFLHARTAGHAGCATPGHDTCGIAAPRREVDGTVAQRALPSGRAVVQLTSEGCPACRRMEPVVRRAGDDCAAAGARVLDLDVDSVEGGALASSLHVTETPTVVLFDAEHGEIERMKGARSLDEVRAAFQRAYGVACLSTGG